MEEIYYQQFASLCFAVLTNLLGQVAFHRLPPRLPLVMSGVLGFVAGFVALVVANFFLPKFDWAIAAVNAGLYVSGGYCYFHLINIGEASIRIRILRELMHSSEGLTEEQILAQYDCKWIVDARMKRLLSSGQILKRNDLYFEAKPQLLHYARIFRFLKWFVLGSVKPIGP